MYIQWRDDLIVTPRKTGRKRIVLKGEVLRNGVSLGFKTIFRDVNKAYANCDIDEYPVMVTVNPDGNHPNHGMSDYYAWVLLTKEVINAQS